MSNDLGPMWLKDNLASERRRLGEVQRAYERIDNKDTQYAQGVKRLLDARLKVVKIWKDALEESLL